MDNEKTKEIRKEGEKTAQPRKKLNIVFRSQNSTSIKELPKALKEAAGAGKKTAETKKTQTPEKKGPRPLPAGTKPVKPAVYGTNEIKNQKVMPEDQKPKLKKAEKQPVVAEEAAVKEENIKAAEAPAAGKITHPAGEVSAVAADKMKKTVPSRTGAGLSGEKKEEAASAAPGRTEDAIKEAAPKAEGAKTENGKAQTVKADLTPEQAELKAAEKVAEKVTEKTAERDSARKADKATNKTADRAADQSAERAADKAGDKAAGKTAEKTQEKASAKVTDGKNGAKQGSVPVREKETRKAGGNQTEKTAGKEGIRTISSVVSQELPKVKILKSYANYDANAIIHEASQAQRQKAMEERKQAAAQSGRRPGQAGGRVQDGKTAATVAGKGGRTFIARNPRTGEENGGRPGGYTPRQGQPGRPAAGRPSQPGQGSPSAFDARGAKNAAAKGRNAYSNKDKDRKDKYRDEIQQPKKNGKGAFIKPDLMQQAKPEDDIKVIVIPETLTIRDLSDKLRIQPSVIVKKLFLQGKMVTPNTELSYEEAESIAMEYDILCEKEVPEDVIAELLKEEEEDQERMIPRSPIVCVMGHVDHGKTSLLDAIRNTSVTSREAGGITQAIGASVVSVDGRNITFLDTPGHEAFTAMRLRGAQATDIAVLVVAADDGVKPQTVEAINHAKSAGVEIVVAINKIDKPAANIEKVKKELTEYDLVAEEWGGSTPMVPLSAKTGEGISDLLEMLLLEADVLELKADPNRNARGIVIEAQLDKGRGPVATVLVQKGTLRIGDNVAAGACYGKVRAMLDDKGNRVKKAGPSTPVEILGLNDVPNAGEVFMGCEDEKEARNIADTFIAENKRAKLEETRQKMNLDDLFDEIQAGNIKELPIIIKADVQGSVEAVRQSLGKMSNEEVAVKVIHSGVGNINESDVALASAANAIIIGFNVKPDPVAKSTAEHENVDIRLYKVIYQAIDDLEAALTGMLAPVYEEKITGHAIVRQLFKASGVGTIAGCFVTDGVVERGSRARITRGDRQTFDGNIASLKRFKDEVREVKTGFECGMVFEDFSELAEDDMVEIYRMVEVPRTPKKTAEA